MIDAVYGAALTLAGPLLRARLAWRARREPLYGERVAERFGRYDAAALEEFAQWRARPGPRLWLHAVSLGETRAAAALVAALRTRQPGLRVLWTHGTATGRAAGAEMLGPGDLQVWQPFDSPGAVRRFFEVFEPTAGVLMETEVWPGLALQARQRGLPLILANARLSERSLSRGRRFAALLRPAFAGLSAVLAQTEDDAARLVAAGADAQRVQVTGNLKFDMTPAPQQLALGQTWKRSLQRPVVLMASSREGEEAELLKAWSLCLERMERMERPAAGARATAADEAPPVATRPDGAGGTASPRPLLLIVPRHPQRFDAVASLVGACGLKGVRRSAFGESRPARADLLADVWLGDSLGEMPAYYAMADVALLGGSFQPLGGQNLIEAAACGCPVLMGPHTFNFAEASQGAEAAGAAARVADLPAAVDQALGWVGGLSGPALDGPALDGRRAAGLAFAARHRGAALRMAEAIDAFLAPGSPAG